MIRYILSQDEVREAMILSGAIKPNRKKGIIQAVLCAVLAVIFLIDGIRNPSDISAYVLFGISVLLIPLILILPKKTEEAIVRGNTDGAEITLNLSDEKIEIGVSGENIPDYSWEIEGGQVEKILESEKLFSIILKDNRALGIPKRALDDKTESELKTIFENFVKMGD
jgi:hypothetical protein